MLRRRPGIAAAPRSPDCNEIQAQTPLPLNVPIEATAEPARQTRGRLARRSAARILERRPRIPAAEVPRGGSIRLSKSG